MTRKGKGMELNGIDLIGYETVGNTASFVLDCGLSEAIALDGQELRVAEGGDDTAVFGGYRLTGVERTFDGRTRASFSLALEPNVEQLVTALRQDLSIKGRAIEEADGKAADAQSKAQGAVDRTDEMATQIEAYGEAIEELAAQVLGG